MTGGRLPRSYLYVPGNADTKLAKALTRGADALIVDLEDAVPLSLKDDAVERVQEWLATLPDPGDVEIWVRINGGARRRSETLALAGSPWLTGLALAKADDAGEVAAVGSLLDELGDSTTLLMPLIESAVAVLDARAIAAVPRVHRLQIGEVDLTGELGIEPGPDEAELLALRTQVLVASLAAGIAPPMAPVSRVTRDMVAFAESTRRARRQGFVGRACIHPAQVAVVHGVFTPHEDEVSAAHETVRLATAAEQSGSAVVLDAQGRLVDPAVVKAALRTLALSTWGRS
jgi:citrate lyase subunit beta/citryl-CoA lyase